MPEASGPDFSAVEATMVAVVREHQPVEFDELDELVAKQCGIDLEDGVGRAILDEVAEFLTADDGPLALLAGDLVIEVETLVGRSAFTHRINDAELALGYLAAPTVDLAAFRRRRNLRLPSGGVVDTFSVEPGHVAWAGPEGWLDGYAPGSLLSFRLEGDVVRIEGVENEPSFDDALRNLLSEVYEAEIEEPGLPVRAEELVLGMLARQPAAFASETPPLRDLAESAGLEFR